MGDFSEQVCESEARKRGTTSFLTETAYVPCEFTRFQTETHTHPLGPDSQSLHLACPVAYSVRAERNVPARSFPSIPLTPPPRSARRRGPGRLLVEMVSVRNRRETAPSHRWCIEINLFSGKFLVFGRLKCCGCLRSCTSHGIMLRPGYSRVFRRSGSLF